MNYQTHNNFLTIFNKIKKIILNPIVVACLIAILSVSPSPKLTNNNLELIPHLDKLIHLIMYFTLSITLLKYFNTKYIKTLKINTIVLIFSSFYGIFMEILQFMSNLGRNANLLDILANEVGIILAIIIYNNSNIKKFL